MEIVGQEAAEPQITPFDEICPRHGVRIRQHFGCPKCVIEEVRRHERRMDALLEYDEPIPADPAGQPTEIPAHVG